MNAKAVAACSLALSLALMSGAQTQDKESAVVLKCRGNVLFQPLAGKPAKVSTLKSFNGKGSFTVQPGSEVTFYDFRTASRVTVKVPADSKQFKLAVGSGSISAKEPTVTVQVSQRLAALSSDSFQFRESIGAASAKTPTRVGGASSATGGRPGTKQPDPQDKFLPNSETPAPSSLEAAPASPPERCLFTVWENPLLRLTEQECQQLGSGNFYRRIGSGKNRGSWDPCESPVYKIGKLQFLRPNYKLQPGEGIEIVRSQHPPNSFDSAKVLVARYNQTIIDSLEHQKVSSTTLEARMEYLAGLVSLQLFAEADSELKSLARDFPKSYDWEQLRRDISQH